MMHAFVLAAAALLPQEGQRLDVLFIGDRGHHRPAERLHDVYGPLLRAGFAVDWEEDLEFVTAERLADYDAVCMYANQPQHRVVPPGFMGALKGFVQGGGGFVALHCTSGCFMESQDWLEFVGARFRSHESEVFQQEVVRPEHAIMAGWENFRAWDETYVQDHHAEGREVLTVRGDEPWSWVKDYGQGRIFYTASGHDERVWRQPAFLDLLIRSLDWAAGEDAAAARKAWHAPVFETEAHGWVPNYEGHQPPPPYQKPSTPEQARRALVVPAGFEAVLFAAEPMVVNPIAMDWDARGRLWVIESPDYPNGVAPERKGGDRISILTDEDGDGRADKKQVFYEGLNLPTSLLVVPGAVLVTQAPDLLALLDEDGDDRCDSVRTVLSGFGTWDTHAGPSNLTLGPDNAIWGSVGYANFTGADGKAWGSGLWRLLPDAREPEFVAQFTNNTWGLGMRPDGEIFGSTANGAPSFFVGAPKALLADTDANAPGAAPVYDTSLFHPALEVLHQGDFLGHYTAAAGHQFAFGPQMPANWAERSAFVCGPTGHLVGRFQTYTRGSGYESRDCFNLCVSLDDWFCPVQAEVGPDGAVWVADFAQFLILHNLPGNPERGLPKVDYGKGNAHMNPLRDTEHGRIFRIQRKGAPAKVADMSKADARGWMALLDSDNHFWREKARLHMGERIDRSLVPALLAVESPGSMQVLASWRQLENEEGLDLLHRSLTSGAPYLQKHALMLLPEITAAAELLAASNVLESANATVRRHALLAAARMPESPALGVALAARAMREDASDAWLGQALRAAVARHAASFLVAAEPLLPKETEGPPANLLANGNLENADPADASQPAHWRVRTYGGEAEHTWQAGAGRDGTRALVIRSSVGADTSWCTDVAVEPATRYRLSAWIHTTDLTHPGGTHGALLNIHPRHVVTEYVQDNQDWTEVSLEFLTGPDERSVSINCLYGGWGRSTGTAVYDDLRLISLGPALDLRSLVELARVKSGMESAPIEATADDALMAGGDAARGRDLFFNNATIACNRCHAWNGQGGGLGPDLVDVRKRLTRAKILESILDPGAALAESWTAPATVMPALRPFLSDQEVRDLVEFLAAGPRD